MAKANLRQFNYQKAAKLDTAMWQSYANADREFFGLFIQAFSLIKYQLGFSWPATIKLAYYAGRAAAAYRLRKGKENYPLARRNLTKLFETVSRNCDSPFDFKRAAKLELEWWDIQRYPEKHQKTLAQSLNENMAAVYGVSAASIKGYGNNRAAALELLNDGSSKQMATLLTKAWQSLHSGVQNTHSD
ncbi:MAG TPA: hypothetical protein VFC50_02330 [Candidatus Dormibacteraeota bacterium]|nr:hypothetical protein [Candidatus Dormibacteraeota bacterium]